MYSLEKTSHCSNTRQSLTRQSLTLQSLSLQSLSLQSLTRQSLTRQSLSGREILIYSSFVCSFSCPASQHDTRFIHDRHMALHRKS